MNKLRAIKIALSIIILAEEIKRAKKHKTIKLKISNLDELRKVIDEAIVSNDLSELENFKPILNQD